MVDTGCRCEKPTKLLRMEADFSADPIWCDICNFNLDLPKLPLSFELKNELMKWILEYGKWLDLNTDKLVNRAFELQREHNEWGFRLFLKVESELGNQYCIRFSPSTSVETYIQRDLF
ncbi:hypothetical protein DP73_18005 [Desulfosporosinus sp. HMP52]|uniref:hypothetical protein n=1 Tax=Desulfosporosinus sp. HMP52 TaxID=1487923 RepID=UPI00051FF26E|nr:hypothetical protein [Desulfosporosinus sp. HMP52]KGK85828.1 hypothetical protein DP73_18005 [Desulfosporosinus sp. HMP52]